MPSSPTRKGQYKRECVRWSFVPFQVLVLIMLTSLLGKNLAKNTADFGKDSLASRRHLRTGREDCFQMSIRLAWPCAFCTHDLEHTLSSAHSVSHATPHLWCMCADPLDFFIDEDFRGHDIIGSRRRRRQSGKLRVFTNVSCVCVLNMVGCCTHDIEGVLSSAARAPLCRLMAKLRIYFSKDERLRNRLRRWLWSALQKPKPLR